MKYRNYALLEWFENAHTNSVIYWRLIWIWNRKWVKIDVVFDGPMRYKTRDSFCYRFLYILPILVGKVSVMVDKQLIIASATWSMTPSKVEKRKLHKYHVHWHRAPLDWPEENKSRAKLTALSNDWNENWSVQSLHYNVAPSHRALCKCTTWWIYQGGYWSCPKKK